jgi:Kef-type K+ transport system membrane component KefB
MPALPLSDPIAILFAFTLILVAVPVLCKWARLPPLVGLIAAGALLGPACLGVFPRLRSGGSGLIESLSSLGAIYLMFLAGLEIDILSLRRHRVRSALFGLLSFALPFAAGFLLARLCFGYGPLSSFLIGALLSSHTLITYPQVSALSLSRNRAVTGAVGGTVVTDTLALIALAVAEASTQAAGDALHWAVFALSMAAYFALVAFVLPRVARALFSHLKSDGTSEFLFVLAALLLASYAAELAGLEPLIGAFVAGLALNRLVPENGVLLNRLQFTGNSLFIPFFLVSVGMRADFGSLANRPDALVLALALFAAVVAAKYIAAWAFSRASRFTKAERGLVFGLTVNKAAATVAIATVGASLGLFGDDVLAAAVLIVVGTCLIGAFATDRHAKALVSGSWSRGSPGQEPQRILVPMSNYGTSSSLLELAFLLRSRDSQEPIFALSVVREGEGSYREVAKAEKILAPAVLRGISSGIPVTPVTRVAHNPADGIGNASRDLRISCVLLGWNEAPSLGQRVFGDVLRQLVAREGQLLVAARLSKSLAGDSRLLSGVPAVVALLPPLGEQHSGFVGAVRAVALLASRFQSRLVLLGESATLDAALPLVSGEEGVEPELVRLGAWQDCEAALPSFLALGSFLAALSPRPGQLGWQPAAERLPRAFAEEREDLSVLLLYLSDCGTQRQEAPEPTPIASGDIAQPLLSAAARRGWIKLGIVGGQAPSAILEALEGSLPKRPDAARRLSEILGEVAKEAPVELAPGTVLLHAHVQAESLGESDASLLSEPLCVVASCPEGVAFDGASEPATILFMLVAPEGQAPEEHLRSLAEIAKAAQDAEAMAALRESRSISELAHRLSLAGRTAGK